MIGQLRCCLAIGKSEITTLLNFSSSKMCNSIMKIPFLALGIAFAWLTAAYCNGADDATVGDGPTIEVMTESPYSVDEVAFSPNGKLLVIVYRVRRVEVELWDGRGLGSGSRSCVGRVARMCGSRNSRYGCHRGCLRRVCVAAPRLCDLRPPDGIACIATIIRCHASIVGSIRDQEQCTGMIQRDAWPAADSARA